MERKLIFGIMAYDREPYFTSVVRNLYSHAKKIVVIEGYEEMYWKLSDCNWTQKKVKELDTEGKIAYKNIGRIQNSPDGITWNKNEIMQELIDEAGKYANEGDWIIYLGADELWRSDTLDFMLTLPEDVVWVGVPFDNFIGDLYHMIVRRKEAYTDDSLENKFYDKFGNFMVNGLYHERAFRFFKGYNFRTNHTAVKDGDKRYVYADPSYQSKRVLLPLDSDLRWVHYGYVGEMDWILRKLIYHNLRQVDSPDLERSFPWNEDRYRWIFHGWCRQNPSQKIVRISDDYKHPYPMEEHPYFGKTRQEIVFGLQSKAAWTPDFDNTNVKFDRGSGYYLDV
jgi:hypothetical protein